MRDNLLDLAIEAHGGLKLWRGIKEVELNLSMTGALLQINGYPAGMPNITMKIAAHEQRMSISPYPHPGQNGNLWRRLHVIFPASIPTHSQEQVFYFNEAGLLQRLDYTPRMSGHGAAHYCFDHRSFDGLMIPSMRRVVSRPPSGPQINGPSGVLVVITDAVVHG